MTKEQASQKAMEMLRKYSLEQLIEQWEVICVKKASRDVVNVRTWILDAIEERKPEEMERFYDSDAEDLELRKFLI